MNPISNYTYTPQASLFKSRRDEIVNSFVGEINKLRLNTKYKPVAKKQIALRLNMNPKTAKSDDECEYLLNECLRKNSFSKFFFCCPLK